MAAQHLRPKPWLLAVAVAAAVLFVIGLLFTYGQNGWTWVSLVFAGLTLVGGAGVLDVATTRVVLHDDVLECGPLWARRQYLVSHIQSVTWERGAGVVLKLASGGWAKLPELGYNAQGLTNTIRAWLKRRQHAC